MKLFIIKTKGRQKPVALLYAETISNLFWLVDERVDPFYCKYAEIKNIGGVWDPSWMDEHEGFVSEYWYRLQENLDWKEFTRDDYKFKGVAA